MNERDKKEWLEHATNGNGQFAIALALIEIADALERLGFNGAQKPMDMGAIEGLTVKLCDVAGSIAMSIEEVASAINTIGGKE